MTTMTYVEFTIRTRHLHDLWRPPFLLYGIQLHHMAPIQHGNRTNRIRLGAYNEPLIPYPTQWPRPTYTVFLFSFISLAEDIYRGLRLGP